MLVSEWVEGHPNQETIHWIDSQLDASQTTEDILFPNEFPNEGGTELVSSLIWESEGEHAAAGIDPFSGIVPPQLPGNK